MYVLLTLVDVMAVMVGRVASMILSSFSETFELAEIEKSVIAFPSASVIVRPT